MKRPLLLALVLLAAGCSSRNTWFDQRGRDFADIWRVNFSGMGPGFTLMVRATQLAKFGGGYEGFERGAEVGLGTWRIGTLGRYAGTWRADALEYGAGPFYYEEFSQEPVVGNVPIAGDSGWFEPEYRSADEVGFTFHLGVFGMDFAVRPLEFFDFLVGIVTVDPMGDDLLIEDPSNVPPDLEEWEKNGR